MLSEIELEQLELLLSLTSKHDSFFEFIKDSIYEYRENWHHKIICDRLQKLTHQKNQRIMIFAPPRHTKSEIMSRQFPAWFLGHCPDKQIVGASYGDDLAVNFNRAVQRTMDSELFKEVFPQVRIPRPGGQNGKIRNADEFEILGEARGGYRTASVGGALTGFGGDLLLLDDPIKDLKEAMSERSRETLRDWFDTVFMTRAQPGANVVITLTRWHEDDLAGHLEQSGEWEIIRLPALAEEELHPEDPRSEGQALWPDQKSEEELAGIRKSMGSLMFSSMYQQNPNVKEGNFFTDDHFKFHNGIEIRKGDRECISIDATFEKGKTSDYVAILKFVVRGADKYLTHRLKKQMGFLETLKEIERFTKAHPNAHLVLIERKANGHAIYDTLKGKVAGLVSVSPTISKELRAQLALPQLEAGNLILPNPDTNPWVTDYLNEFKKFPKGKHDDQVDATVQLLNHLKTNKMDLLAALSKW